MKRALRALDRILRGDATRLPVLQEGRFDIPVGGLVGLIVLLGMAYGFCMALPTLIARWNPPTEPFLITVYEPAARQVAYVPTLVEGFEQTLASMVKVPLLFLLTLLVTFPSLYVFNALVGSRLTMGALLKLLVAAISVMIALLAAFGPIVAFFAACTTSYPFMKVLNVIVFTIAGFMGLAFLLQTLHRLTLVAALAPAPAAEPAAVDPAVAADPAPADVSVPPPLSSPLDRLPNRPPDVTLIFRIWVVVFGIVGAQMAWVLRPFIGDPTQPFSFFRARESNFFEGLAHTFGHLFGW